MGIEETGSVSARAILGLRTPSSPRIFTSNTDNLKMQNRITSETAVMCDVYTSTRYLYHGNDVVPTERVALSATYIDVGFFRLGSMRRI